MDVGRMLVEEMVDENSNYMASVIHTYHRHFTANEIRQMLEWQASPVGRKSARVTPMIMQELTELRVLVNKEVSALTTMLNRMVDHGVIDQSPIKRKISKLEEDNIRNKSLKHEEFQRILENLKSPLFEMTILAYYTAMRQKEIMNLQWEQVDLERGIITVKGSETKNSLTKFIPIHPELNQYLKNIDGSTKSGHVVQSNGKALKNYSGHLKKQWNLATMNAAIKDLHFHDLRHVATNNLRKSVIDPIKLKSITGHKSDRALNRYIFVSPDEMQDIEWNFS